MKKTISALCALALLVPATAFAQNHNDRDDHKENTHSQSTQQDKKAATKQTSTKPNSSNKSSSTSKSGSTKAPATQKSSSSGHKFAKGQRFDRSKAANYRRVSYREHSKLSAPPSGYVWVRAGNDALLVRLSNNLIIRIVANIY